MPGLLSYQGKRRPNLRSYNRNVTNNLQYEERLGTAPMVPLVFRMALPAVVAQLVNLLYNSWSICYTIS